MVRTIWCSATVFLSSIVTFTVPAPVAIQAPPWAPVATPTPSECRTHCWVWHFPSVPPPSHHCYHCYRASRMEVTSGSMVRTVTRIWCFATVVPSSIVPVTVHVLDIVQAPPCQRRGNVGAPPVAAGVASGPLPVAIAGRLDTVLRHPHARYS